MAQQRTGDLPGFLAAAEGQKLRLLRAQRLVDGLAEGLGADAGAAERGRQIALAGLSLPQDRPCAAAEQAVGLVRALLPAPWPSAAPEAPDSPAPRARAARPPPDRGHPGRRPGLRLPDAPAAAAGHRRAARPPAPRASSPRVRRPRRARTENTSPKIPPPAPASAPPRDGRRAGKSRSRPSAAGSARCRDPIPARRPRRRPAPPARPRPARRSPPLGSRPAAPRTAAAPARAPRADTRRPHTAAAARLPARARACGRSASARPAAK